MAGKRAAPRPGGDVPLPGPRAVFRPILPKAGTHLLRLPPPRSLLFSLDGGVLVGLCMPRGFEKLALERGDAAADGGKDEAGGRTDFGFASLAPA